MLHRGGDARCQGCWLLRRAGAVLACCRAVLVGVCKRRSIGTWSRGQWGHAHAAAGKQGWGGSVRRVQEGRDRRRLGKGTVPGRRNGMPAKLRRWPAQLLRTEAGRCRHDGGREHKEAGACPHGGGSGRLVWRRAAERPWEWWVGFLHRACHLPPQPNPCSLAPLVSLDPSPLIRSSKTLPLSLRQGQAWAESVPAVKDGAERVAVQLLAVGNWLFAGWQDGLLTNRSRQGVPVD